jgi:hypothetical protein
MVVWLILVTQQQKVGVYCITSAPSATTREIFYHNIGVRTVGGANPRLFCKDIYDHI